MMWPLEIVVAAPLQPTDIALMRPSASRYSLSSYRCSISKVLPDLVATHVSHSAPTLPFPPFLGLWRPSPTKVKLGAR
jgi:hypothetical protein